MSIPNGIFYDNVHKMVFRGIPKFYEVKIRAAQGVQFARTYLWNSYNLELRSNKIKYKNGINVAPYLRNQISNN
jgi:hypothetical protein